MDWKVNVGGTWKAVSDPKVNIGGSWKDVKEGWVNIGGTWKQVFSGKGKIKDICFSMSNTMILMENGDLYFEDGNLGTTDYVFEKVASNVSKIACSTTTAWYIDANGKLFGMGSNNYGQQGNGGTSTRYEFTQVTTNVAEVRCSDNATAYLTTGGRLYCCGANSQGQQGANNTSTVYSFTQRASTSVRDVQVGNYSIAYTVSSGSIYAAGQIASLVDSKNYKKFISIGATDASKFRLSQGGTLWYINSSNKLFGIGYNSSGQQGSGDTTTVKTLTQRASSVRSVSTGGQLGELSCYVTTGNGLYMCGSNSNSQQANGQWGGNVKTFTQRASSVSDALAIIGKGYIYLTTSGKIYCIGYCGFETNPTYSFADVTPSGKTIRAIFAPNQLSADYGSVFVITTDEDVYAVNFSNAYGNLGNGSIGSTKGVGNAVFAKVGFDGNGFEIKGTPTIKLTGGEFSFPIDGTYYSATGTFTINGQMFKKTNGSDAYAVSVANGPASSSSVQYSISSVGIYHGPNDKIGFALIASRSGTSYTLYWDSSINKWRRVNSTDTYDIAWDAFSDPNAHGGAKYFYPVSPDLAELIKSNAVVNWES